MLEDKGMGFPATAWKEFDPMEKLLTHPLLLKISVVRKDGMIVIGYNPAAWEHCERSL